MRANSRIKQKELGIVRPLPDDLLLAEIIDLLGAVFSGRKAKKRLTFTEWMCGRDEPGTDRDREAVFRSGAEFDEFKRKLQGKEESEEWQAERP